MSKTEESGIFMYVYANEQNSLLVFAYSESANSGAFFLDQEGYDVEEILVNGMTADLYLAKDNNLSNSIIWCDDEARVIFYVSGQLDGGELKNIAESVKTTK